MTLLCGGDAYVPGVEALGSSLRATATREPAVVMVTADVSAAARERLARQGWLIREIEPIANPNPATSRLFPRFEQTFCKLRAWSLAEFDKLVYLDADTIVLRNLDWLFDRPHFAAAPDFFFTDRFNSGVMVLDPSPDVFQALLQKLGTAPSYDGGDQGFLNDFYPDWYAMPVAHRLPSGCNLHHFVFQFLNAHTELKQQMLEEVFVVHYTLQKPWLTANMSGASEIWWRSYFDVYPERQKAWKTRLHSLQDWTFESVVGLLAR